MTTIDWRELTHAFGSAADIPGLFALLGGSEDDVVWCDLWSALCHQGSVYDASWASLSTLADVARGRAPGEPFQAVILAGAITSYEADPRRELHGRAIGELRDAAREMLAVPGRPAPVFVNLLQSLLAFEGVGVWPEALAGVNSEEFELECPACEEGLYVAFGGYGTFVSAEDYVSGTDGQAAGDRGELTPMPVERLSALGARLHGEAASAGQTEVARALTYVFGEGRCPSCDTVFSVAQEVEKQWV
ncbi:hypothetical protein OG895_45930 [Streptomyces sp. NBC_00201]|uniref:hypothetical protein n=1 Tax=unclassified Streptomyces TaxID=2593676 RepID=UPI002251AD23|nr:MULTISPECIES: hypothetical protein [unclassified Streptomyces]MCX5252376.1 hypothetical protein [Streptomyces sp. NBC_00201]MCX5290755.1 hypothetical protein [Streptomyces sp. NBC_00183]